MWIFMTGKWANENTFFLCWHVPIYVVLEILAENAQHAVENTFLY